MSNYLTPEQVAALTDACDDIDLSLRIDYSGRFMYGAMCVAIVGEGNAPAMLVNQLHENDSPDLANLLVRLSMLTDNMGRSYVFYWPSLKVGTADRQALQQHGYGES